MVPVLSDLRERVHTLAQAEVGRFLPRVRRAQGDAELQVVLDDFAQALANKFLHGPTVGARRAATLGHEPEVTAVLRELFLSGDGE